MKEKPKESVWDYPRPPRVELFDGLIEVIHSNRQLAKSTRSFRVLETSHPPVFYIPQDDIRMELLSKNNKTSICEFKGKAVYFDLIFEEQDRPDVAWCYENPRRSFEEIRGHLAFYPGKIDACYVDGEKVAAQKGDFYGGWITANIEGPFKGGPGT